MANKTSISWTQSDDGRPGATWNPIRGCSLVSEGCRNCYAMRQARRFAGPGQPYEGLVNLKTGKWTGEVAFVEDHLHDPLKWRTPRRVFVNSMSDLFYERFSNEEIAAVFGVMAACPQHTFQVLTKRPERMREWFAWVGDCGLQGARAACRVAASDRIGRPVESSIPPLGGFPWPLPNVWLGTSVENQAAADERIPHLLATPAAVRFLSCEPLLGPLDLRGMTRADMWSGGDWLRTYEHSEERDGVRVVLDSRPRVDWIIAGCESGPGARPCNVEWLRSIRDQCTFPRVPFFLKQAGDWRVPLPERNGIMTAGHGSRCKAGGVIELPYLDGVQHAAFPT